VPAFVRIVVGLGNPGERYRNTWHNLGARTVEELARRTGVVLRPGKGEYLGAEARIEGNPVMLMTPTSFMNRSGGPVSLWMRYQKVQLSELLVVYDDHDIPLGKLRLRAEGSAGGHRGIEDIIQLMGEDRFSRIKIGIQTEREAANLADQVLAPIPKIYSEVVERVVIAAADAIEATVREGITTTANRYNGVDYK